MIPENAAELINYMDDASRVMADPLLRDQAGVVLPRWVSEAGLFADGSTTIRQAFERLVGFYGSPAAASPVIDTANAGQTPTTDILGNFRPAALVPDIGAWERQTAGTASHRRGLSYRRAFWCRLPSIACNS